MIYIFYDIKYQNFLEGVIARYIKTIDANKNITIDILEDLFYFFFIGSSTASFLPKDLSCLLEIEMS